MVHPVPATPPLDRRPRPPASPRSALRSAATATVLLAGLLVGKTTSAEPPAAATSTTWSPPAAPPAVFWPPVRPGLPPLPAISPTGPFAWTPQPGQLLPDPDTGMIAGGVTLTVLGAGSAITGVVLFLAAPIVGATGGEAWKDYLGAGAATLALGGLGIGLGVPLIKSGARRTAPSPAPGAQIWLAPARLTVTF